AVLAASLVVVAAGVGAYAVAFGGGGEQQAGAGDSTRLAEDPTITPADPGGGGQVEDTSSTQQEPTRGRDSAAEATRDSGQTASPTEDSGRPASMTTVDSAAIDGELANIFDGLDDPDQRPRLMVRAEDIFNDLRVPESLRGQAAYSIGYGHLVNGDRQSACTWIDRAIQMRPGNTGYQSTRATWGCTQ
ncbi:MAG: hypothetical protein JSW51_07190, partial [Gemmatimonadota bacterium]